ncbi:MAG: DNA repair protein RadC [Bacteroidales bacterium]|nr:DNA repair protein RadC [Bacteroidales bacterium]
MEVRNLSLKEWADEDKPREKLLANGKKALTNAELVAILLRSGCHGMSAVDLAKQLLDRAGNSLANLSRLEVSDIQRLKGMGKTKAITLIAALELGYRLQGESRGANVTHARSSQELCDYIAPSIIDLKHEEFWVIYLDNSLKISGKQRVAAGGITSVDVDMRLLFRGAIERNAVKIALAHNHPSGSLTPSSEDKALTNKIMQAADTLDIKVVDHIIVGLPQDNGNRYYSFKDNGIL